MVPSSYGLLDRIYSSHFSELYNPRAFIVHAVWLRQAFAHCARFLTAASRRSLDRVSVPVWPFTLSGRLSVIALVGHYPTNKLIDRRLISKQVSKHSLPLFKDYKVLALVSQRLSLTLRQIPTYYSPVRHSCLPRRTIFTVRLACLRPTASVSSEPGSNSPQ